MSLIKHSGDEMKNRLGMEVEWKVGACLDFGRAHMVSLVEEMDADIREAEESKRSCTCRYGVVVRGGKTVGKTVANQACQWLHSIRSIQETKEYYVSHPFHHPQMLLEFNFCPKCGRDLREM